MTDGPAGYGAPPPPAPQFTVPKDPKEWLIPIAGLLAFIGSIMPWVTVSISILGNSNSTSAAGTKSTEGVFVLILGLVLIVLGVLPWTSVKLPLPPATTLVVAGLLFICAIWGMIDVLTNTSDSSGLGGLSGLSGSGFSVGSGFGLWVTVIAAVLAVGAAYLDFKKKSAPKAM